MPRPTEVSMRRASVKTNFRNSINEHQHCRVLRRLDYILKLPFRRQRLFKFARHVWDRLREAQEQAAFHRAIHRWSSRFSVSPPPSKLKLELQRPGCTGRLI